MVAAGFEVIDAVVIAPAPRSARPGASSAAFAFDTPAEPDGPTLIESERAPGPRPSRSARPWWRREGDAHCLGGHWASLRRGHYRGQREQEEESAPTMPASSSADSPPSNGKRKETQVGPRRKLGYRPQGTLRLAEQARAFGSPITCHSRTAGSRGSHGRDRLDRWRNSKPLPDPGDPVSRS